MIQNLVSPIINEVEVENLKYVNPYWAHDLNKYIKKANKWTGRFKGNNEHFVMNSVFTNSQLPEFSKKLSEYKNYLMQRYDMIKTNLRFIRKFNGWISSYTILVGMTTGIKTMSTYWYDVNNKTIENKVRHLISLTNTESSAWLDKLKAKVNSIIKNDEFLKLVFDGIISFDEKFNQYDRPVMEIMGYARKMFKKKKISEADLINITVEVIEFLTLTNSLNFMSQQFAKKVY
jgi:hypothetical protein